MAPPKSENKRAAILEAATRIFAESGPASTPTAEISRAAGIAEGTLFNYFKTKGELVSTLYREAKRELAESLLVDFPARKKLRRRLRHLWDAYLAWGITHTPQRRALAQIEGSNLLDPDARQTGDAPLIGVRAALQEMHDQGNLRAGLSVDFVSLAFESLAAATMECLPADPPEADAAITASFKLFWKGIARKKARRH